MRARNIIKNGGGGGGGGGGVSHKCDISVLIFLMGLNVGEWVNLYEIENVNTIPPH